VAKRATSRNAPAIEARRPELLWRTTVTRIDPSWGHCDDTGKRALRRRVALFVMIGAVASRAVLETVGR
jgi:hypothetical protein